MHIRKKRNFLEKSLRKMLFILCFAVMWMMPYNLQTGICAAGQSAVELNAVKKNMVVGERFKLKAGIEEDMAKNYKLLWKSSKSSVASVSQRGIIKAKKKGTAKITAVIKGTDQRASCIVNVTDIFSEQNLAADLNGDGNSENINVKDIRTENGAYVLLTAQINGKKADTKKYNGYYSSSCMIGDLSGNGADDVLLVSYETASVHGEIKIHVLHFADMEWKEYPEEFIKNPFVLENIPECFSNSSADGKRNTWVGASILNENGRNYLRCILLDTEDPEFDTVKCIDASYQEEGWYIENLHIIENYYSGKIEKDH